MKNSNVQYETERARYQQRFESVSSQRDTVSNKQGFLWSSLGRVSAKFKTGLEKVRSSYLYLAGILSDFWPIFESTQKI